jgi:hypothetical protein
VELEKEEGWKLEWENEKCDLHVHYKIPKEYQKFVVLS